MGEHRAGGNKGGHGVVGWPSAFGALTRELRTGRGRPAFVDSSDPDVDLLVGRLASVVDRVASLGERIGQMDQTATVDDLLSDLSGSSTLLMAIDVLFAPALHLEVISQLRRVAQSTAPIVVWPGRIHGGRVTYSLPGRADHVDEPARDLVVLRPVDAEFPDEVPYTVERYPA